MPPRKLHKKDLKYKKKDQIGDTMHHGKLPKDKVKYKHKDYWLAQDEEYDLVSNHVDEEE